MNKPVLTFIIGFSSGCGVAWIAKPESSPITPLLAHDLVIQRDFPRSVAPFQSSKVEQQTGKVGGIENLPDRRSAELKARMLKLENLPKEESRKAAVQEEFATITLENAVLYQNVWREVTATNPVANAHWAALNRRLGQVAGKEILGKRTGNGGGDMSGVNTYVKDQLLGWMEADPAGAQEWFDGLKNEVFQNALLEAYIKELDDLKKKAAAPAASTSGKTVPKILPAAIPGQGSPSTAQ